MASSSTLPDRPAVDATDAVEAVGLTRVHVDGRRELRSLDNVSLTVAAGEVVAVMGPSGSGKTTLLHLLGGLDRPDAGRVCIGGEDWATLRGADRARFRRRTCGFVVQGQSLLPQATAAENVEVPLLLDAAAARGAGIVLATHDPVAATHAARIVRLRSGRLDPVGTGGAE